MYTTMVEVFDKKKERPSIAEILRSILGFIVALGILSACIRALMFLFKLLFG
jgi:hypothetical protein